MRLPDTLLKGAFDGQFKRGAVIRFLMTDCDDPARSTREKFAILLNLDPTDADSLLVLTTSQIDKQEPFRKRNPEAFVELPIGSYEWVIKPTLIQLEAVRKYPREVMLEQAKAERLEFEEALSSAHIEEIDRKLRGSLLIDRYTLKKIVNLR